MCDDNVLVEERGTGTWRVNPTVDSRGVRTAIQNHAAWLVNGIISDTREHRIRVVVLVPSRAVSRIPLFFRSHRLFLSVSLVAASLHPENGVVSVVAPCGNRPLTFPSLFLSPCSASRYSSWRL